MPNVEVSGNWKGDYETYFVYGIKARNKEVSQEVVDGLLAKFESALAQGAKPQMEENLVAKVADVEVKNISTTLSLAEVEAREDSLIDAIQAFKEEFSG
jgi:hypothetical protein